MIQKGRRRSFCLSVVPKRGARGALQFRVNDSCTQTKEWRPFEHHVNVMVYVLFYYKCSSCSVHRIRDLVNFRDAFTNDKNVEIHRVLHNSVCENLAR